MSERELVGTVAVDSGQIAIVDPSHILEMEDFLKVSSMGQIAGNDYTKKFNICYLDSPSSTSAQTYKIQWHQWNSSYTIYLNRTGSDADNASEGTTMATNVAQEISA